MSVKPLTTLASSTTLEGSTPVPSDQQLLLQRVTTAMFDLVEPVAPVIARQMHQQVPGLGSVEDKDALEATKRSALGSMYELLCITRAGLFGPNVIETSPEALQHLRFLKRRGAGFKTVLGFYRIGFAMFEPLLGYELSRFVPDRATYDAMTGPLRQFVYTYVDQITRRLAVEYGVEREDWVSDPADPSWHDPESVAVIHRWIDEVNAKPRLEEDGASARRYTQRALERFREGIFAAADDDALSSVLARADTTVRIELADDPDLGVTLLLDRNPIELIEDDVDAEVSLSIVSVDLARLYSTDFHLPMAITRGRVKYQGPVRKFLRVTPVIRHATPHEIQDGMNFDR